VLACLAVARPNLRASMKSTSPRRSRCLPPALFFVRNQRSIVRKSKIIQMDRFYASTWTEVDLGRVVVVVITFEDVNRWAKNVFGDELRTMNT
jgi:hypothetical protein